MKHTGLFAAGVLFGTAGLKILGSKDARKVYAHTTANVGGAPVKKQPVKKAPKPGRNDPCPCGKMKADGSRRLKYKECCGRNE